MVRYEREAVVGTVFTDERGTLISLTFSDLDGNIQREVVDVQSSDFAPRDRVQVEIQEFCNSRGTDIRVVTIL